MKLSGTINGRRVKIFHNKWKQPGESTPDFRVYDVTGVAKGEKIDDWKALEIGALWEDGPRAGDGEWQIGPAVTAPIADDDIQF